MIETEIAFNQAVTDTLEEVQRLSQQLDAGRALLQEGQVIGAIDIVETAEQAIRKDNLANTTVFVVLSENTNNLRGEIAEYLRARWNEQLHFNEREAQLVLPENTGERFQHLYLVGITANAL